MKKTDFSKVVVDTISDETEIVEPEVLESSKDGMNKLPADVRTKTNALSSKDDGADIFTRDFSRELLYSPMERDGVLRPLLCPVANTIAGRGESADRVRALLLTYLSSISAKLGYPLSVQLVCDDPLHAASLLDHCMRLAPEDSYIEFGAIKPEHLFINSGSHLEGKTLISTDPAGFKSVGMDLNSLLTRGRASRQLIVNGKYALRVEEVKTELPIAILGVVVKETGRELSHPAILRVPLSSPAPEGGNLQLPSTELLNASPWTMAEEVKIRGTFERLSHRIVEIPFAQQIWGALTETGVKEPQSKLEILLKVISMCTIMNRPPGLYLDELCARVYKVPVVDVRAWRAKGDNQHVKRDDLKEPIIATRMDYAVAWWLLSGLLKVDGGPLLSEGQRRVFETVKLINESKSANAMARITDEVKKCSLIAKSTSYWTSREQIYEEINKNGGPLVSLTGVYNELVSLMKMGLVAREKPPKSRHFGYYVTTLSIDKDVVLPHPSNINDDSQPAQSVEIVNPITGMKEKI